ncbi:MAG: diacylglycerol kinase family protein [Clostridia bacterium]|nr:diacylglycerol kinase family protein [Clostridia bacterium]
MSRICVFFNPLCKADCNSAIESLFPTDTKDYFDVTDALDYSAIISELENSDKIMVCGGDGTLNRFVNDIYDLDIKNDILYYATGTGNDFLRDIGLGQERVPIKINDYISKLPVVTVKGKSYRFLNGVGYGIDGYCCEVGDRLRKTSKKPINYTSIAIKGLLFYYKPTDATVTVDGVEYKFKKVWIAPTMAGRYYGGGMLPAPNQRREDREKHVTLTVMHSSGKLKTLMIFPSLFKGEHVKHTKNVTVLEGKSISVKFNRNVALQIDGETILDVSGYDVQLADIFEKSSLSKA